MHSTRLIELSRMAFVPFSKKIFPGHRNKYKFMCYNIVIFHKFTYFWPHLSRDPQIRFWPGQMQSIRLTKLSRMVYVPFSKKIISTLRHHGFSAIPLSQIRKSWIISRTDGHIFLALMPFDSARRVLPHGIFHLFGKTHFCCHHTVKSDPYPK